MLSLLRDAFAGPSQARAAHRQALKLGPSVTAGLRHLQTVCPADPADDPEAPIFLLSAGWRSGSTLLQRLLMSDPRVLIWGEPYDECGLLQAMAQGIQAFRPGWPPPEYFYDGTPPSDLTGEWVANLFPTLQDWRLGQRALLDTMFAAPARRAGAQRWGVKEVRLTAEHALYLRWLYPRCRLLFLVRHPLDAYRSYSAYGRSWYDTFPDRPVFTAARFGAHWAALSQGFLRDAQSLGATLVKYEDLVAGRVAVGTLSRDLDLDLQGSVLNRKIGGAAGGNTPGAGEVNGLERWLLRRQTGTVAAQWGYGW